MCYNDTKSKTRLKEKDLACYVRLMRRRDVTPVTEIDREVFPTLWPPVNYKRDLENRMAHYIVTCDEKKRTEELEMDVSSEKNPSGLRSRVRRLFNYNRFFRYEPLKPGKEHITGFAGFWIMLREAHITSIAVRETRRHQGIGELLLMSVINLATELNTRIITLEVRVSNTIAQGLYYKYGFIQTGLRRHYYIDNKEDAIIMSTENITSVSFQKHLQELKQAHSRKWGMLFYQIVR